jgi:hypothetical protein
MDINIFIGNRKVMNEIVFDNFGKVNGVFLKVFFGIWRRRLVSGND